MLVYDELGEIHLFDTTTGKSTLVPIEVDADLPEACCGCKTSLAISGRDHLCHRGRVAVKRTARY